MLVVVLLTQLFSNYKIEDYDKSWSKVEKYVNEGMPKSAIKIVDEIYKTASSEGNYAQLTKSLIYRISLQSKFEEEHVLKSIEYFEREIKTTQEPVKQILSSLLAELYSAYYSQNRWKINQRGTLQNNESKDISTWDAASFSKATKNYYLQSIENKSFLQSINLEKYKIILNENDSSNFDLFPTLYDQLANRALNYFTGTDAGFDEIEPLRNFDFSAGLGSTSDFLERDFKQDANSDNEQIILGLFRDLINLHKQNHDTIALVDLELRRLEYYHLKAQTSVENDNKYLKSLFDLKEEFYKHAVSVKVSLEIGFVYDEYGEKYNRLGNEKYRWDKQKALKIYEEAIERFPDDAWSNTCRNRITVIKQPSFQFQLHEVELPQKPFLGSLTFTNLSKIYFKIVKLDADDFMKRHNGNYTKEEQMQLFESGVFKSWSVELPDSKDYQEHMAEFKLPALGNGLFLVLASTDSTVSESSLVETRQIWISGLSYVLNNNQSDAAQMFVLNRQSGKGIADVAITVFKRNYQNRERRYQLKEIGKTASQKNGSVSLQNYQSDHYGNYYFRLEKDGDVLYSQTYINYYRQGQKRPVTRAWLFTDRAIYRPGQTVYFKAIVTENIENEYSLKNDFELKLEFKNANYKTISEDIFTTGKHGSFNGEFVIPKGLLNGNFSLKTKYGSANIRVEEYKRPTFFVRFDTLKEQFRLGDIVEVTGSVEDYAGSKLQNAEVKFVVKRNTIIPYRYNFGYYPYYNTEAKEVANGIISTDADGKFKISFEATKDPENTSIKGLSYFFEISVDATDISGETQSAYSSIKLSDAYLFVNINSPETISTENNRGIELSISNSMGAAVEADAQIKLFRLEPLANPLQKRDWAKPDIFLMGADEFKKEFPNRVYKDEDERQKREKQLLFEKSLKVDGQQFIFADEMKNLKPGEYFIKVIVSDKTGKDVETEKYFSLYSSSSSKPWGSDVLSVNLNKTKVQPGEEIILSIASAGKKTRVLYEINNGKTLVERNWINVSRAQKNIKIPVKEEYRGNFSVNVMAVKNNRYYNYSETILVPFDNKKLELKLETFRDYITPGSNEEWQLSISGPEGEEVAAEILAAMYDASLDKFTSNDWSMNLYKNKHQSANWRASLFGTKTSRGIKYISPDYLRTTQEIYPDFNWFGYEFYGNNIFMMKSSRAGEGEEIVAMAVVQDDAEVLEEVDVEQTEVNAAEIAKHPLDTEEGQIPLRSNFSETAFFYPNLKTDSEGNTIISFKTPDALTEWKFMALAYSDDLKVGKLVQNIKARKELMVMPNVPRFVRQGDQINFTAKVVNFSDDAVTANVEIEFFDAVSMKPLSLSEDKLQQNIELNAKSNGKLTWLLEIPFDVSMISYHIKAVANNFSDGEQRSFPVLTNRMLVTETMPMFLNADESKTYNFKALTDKTAASKSIENYRYTVEVTSNPVWYAIQALPYLSENKNNSTLGAFRRYYSNAVSSFIVNSNPEIKRVFESWQQLSPDAFLSNLEKNEDLKNAVLQATPWVLEAENETEQKRRLGILFDINRLANEKAVTFEKLRSSQLSSGAWPWFNGMRDDVFTTQKIALGLAKLHDKGILNLAQDRNTERMLKKAIRFLDREQKENYERLKKEHPARLNKNNLGASQIQYLYLRALLLSEIPIDAKTKEAFDYYSRQAKKYWLKQNLYLQGMIAVSLNKLGHRNEAEAIVRSLDERSLESEEMGMYWRQQRGWHWYQSSVETQAMMIEAFAEIEANPKAVEQMKVWLLKQKQTQRWETPSATLEAVFALLTTGNKLIVENKDIVVRVGGKMVDVEEGSAKEAGSGYFKVSWKGEEINESLSKIELQNPNNNIAWAAAYWQYFEDLDKIETADSPLSLEKKFFVEKLTEKGTVIEELANGEELKTGDKLISRIIIRSDRDMDFVHLRDMRSSALEPVSSLSGYKYSGGLGYYENITDVSTDFFFRRLSKGTYVLEYATFVSQSGKFSNGIATIQSMYAPEFSAHSEGSSLTVGK